MELMSEISEIEIATFDDTEEKIVFQKSHAKTQRTPRKT